MIERIDVHSIFYRGRCGQFHQPIDAKCKCARAESLAKSVSPTKLRSTLPVHRTRRSTQLLLSTPYTIPQLDQCKSTCTKAALKTMVKLTPGGRTPQERTSYRAPSAMSHSSKLIWLGGRMLRREGDDNCVLSLRPSSRQNKQWNICKAVV